MINYVLVNPEQVLGEYNPYANAEMCPYTCRMVPPPIALNCRCSIHTNDRYEQVRKNNMKYSFNKPKYTFDDSHLQTTFTNIISI